MEPVQLIDPANAKRVARLFPAASKDATKPTLQGLHIDPVTPTRLAYCATDGFILAWAVVDRSEPHGLTGPVTLPNAAFKLLVKGAKGRLMPYVTMDPETREVRVTGPNGDSTLFRPEPGNYPAWRRVVPGPQSDLQPLTGHKLVAGVAWTVAEILSELGAGKWGGPEAKHLFAHGMRFGTSDMLLFHRDGVSVIAQEPRFGQNAPTLDESALRASLSIVPRLVEAP